MEEKSYYVWDVVTKFLGFVLTAGAIYVGFLQFNVQQENTRELERQKNFWTSQNQVYTEVCNNAGAMVANVGNPKQFEIEKRKFLTNYYGEMVLVEDSSVEWCMKAIHSDLGYLDLRDQDLIFVFKRKVLELSEACKKSSITFKPTNK